MRRILSTSFHRNLAPCPNRRLLRGAGAPMRGVSLDDFPACSRIPHLAAGKSPGERRQGFFSRATPILSSAPAQPAEPPARQLTALSPTRERAPENRSPARPVVEAAPNRSGTTSRETVMKPAKTTTAVSPASPPRWLPALPAPPARRPRSPPCRTASRSCGSTPTRRKSPAWSALEGGASLIGFDVRPADGKLYGVTPDGAIVIVDVKTGKWEKKSQLSEKLPAGRHVLGRLQSRRRPDAGAVERPA